MEMNLSRRMRDILLFPETSGRLEDGHGSSCTPSLHLDSSFDHYTFYVIPLLFKQTSVSGRWSWVLMHSTFNPRFVLAALDLLRYILNNFFGVKHLRWSQIHSKLFLIIAAEVLKVKIRS